MKKTLGAQSKTSLSKPGDVQVFLVGIFRGFFSFFLLSLIFTLEEGSIPVEYCHAEWYSKLSSIVLAICEYTLNSYLWWSEERSAVDLLHARLW